jgi:DNA-binding beta-propeller fold protein YncE
MSDDRSTLTATQPLVHPRAGSLRRGRSVPGTSLARVWGITGACCLLALSAPVAVSAGTAAAAQLPAFVPSSAGQGSLGTALAGAAPVGNGPSELAVDPATHTVYVTNGWNDIGPSAGGDTVSVIDTRHCQALDISHCRGPWPTITVGNLPSNIAVDQATGTVYVDNEGDNTVSVFNGATCNAMDTSGCKQTPATVPVGLGPQGIFVDDTNHTVYVGDNDFGNATTVSMIDSANCNASDLVTCPTNEPPTVNVGGPADDIQVDQGTHTVYVATGSDIAVFDANTCNATVQSGCANMGALPGDAFGDGPSGFEIDPGNDTLYTANFDETISAWDLAGCNASDLASCATQSPGTVSPYPDANIFGVAIWLAVDAPLHSVYVAYQEDDALAVVDTNLCNGSDLAGCATLHPQFVRTGAGPEAVDLDPLTQTLYTANEIDNDVSVINAATCNAQITSGCRQPPTSLPVQLSTFSIEGVAADPAVNTLYAVTPGNTVSMVNTATCNKSSAIGCANAPAQVAVGSGPLALAVDPATNTVYVSNFGSASVPGTVSVIDASTCNATDQAGCATVGTLKLPNGTGSYLSIDAATHTIYVAARTDNGPDLVYVFNGATCNANEAIGCDQVPAAISVGSSGGAPGNSKIDVAVDQATNTVYATNIVYLATGDLGSGVFVFNGATCDAANTTGCDQTPEIITGGLSSLALSNALPWGIAVDQATETIYVTLSGGGDYSSALWVINGAICNGSDVAGCNQIPPSIPTGYNALGLAVDPLTHVVYTANFFDSTLSMVEGAICNRFTSLGCGLVLPKLPTASFPDSIAIDPAVGTAYVASFEFGISVVPLVP